MQKLNNKLYKLGIKYNNVIKYNIQYDRLPILDYVCATYIRALKYAPNVTDELKSKLDVVLNNLVVL